MDTNDQVTDRSTEEKRPGKGKDTVLYFRNSRSVQTHRESLKKERNNGIKGQSKKTSGKKGAGPRR